MSNRGSITLSELQGKPRPARNQMSSVRASRPCQPCTLIDNHGADTGLPDLWETLAGDCQHARSTAVHNRCAICYPQLPALFLPSKQA